MVEIEQIPDDPTPQEGKEEEEKETEDGLETTKDGWQKLMGDDLVMTVIDTSKPKNGKDAETVQPQDAVLIDFIGRIASDKSIVDGPIFQKVQGWLVVVGDGDVLPALEMAIRFMETGQTSRVWSHSKYAFGPGIRKSSVGEGEDVVTVAPHSGVMFEVTVNQIVMDTSRLNPYFTIQKALTRKKIANDVYQYEWCPPPKTVDDPSCETAMGRVLRLYQKAAKDMETLLDGTYFQQVEKDHPQRNETKQILMDSLNNIVAVYLKQQEYHKAKQAAIEVLKIDSKNLKALLRAAKASLYDPASTLEEVSAALKAAESEITYKNPQEEKELKRLKTQFKRKQQEYKQQTKKMFGNKLKKSTNAFGSEDDEDEDDNHTGGVDNVDDSTTKKKTPITNVELEEMATMNMSDRNLDIFEDDDDEEEEEFENKKSINSKNKTKQEKEKEIIASLSAKSTQKTSKSSSFFGKGQWNAIIVQMLMPLLLFWLYRFFIVQNGRDGISKHTLAADVAKNNNDDELQHTKPIVKNSIEGNDFDDHVDEDEVINLDI